MQTQAKNLLALWALSTLAAAQSAPPAENPAAKGPVFNFSDAIPGSPGYGDAYSLNEIRLGGQVLNEEQQVARWQAELAAGRARAGALVGAYLSYRALTPTACETARVPLLKADELGSDQAPALLAELAANDTCGTPDRTAVERWHQKAVSLDYPGSLLELIRLYGGSSTPEDRQQQYVYARVASGYWDAIQAVQPRVGFDAQALQEMELALTADNRSRAQADAARILAVMLDRHKRFIEVEPAEFARGDAGGKAGYVAWQADYRHECQWNLKKNCRGTQRVTFVDLTSKNAQFLSCRIDLRARDFVTGNPVAEPLTRQVLLGPNTTRRLLLGDVYGEPDRKSIEARCTPVPDLAAESASGKCRARLQDSIDVARFYPEAAKQRGIEGSTVVRYWLPPGSDLITDAEIATSSGDVSLDDAAIATLQGAKFTRACEYGIGSIRISFKLTE